MQHIASISAFFFNKFFDFDVVYRPLHLYEVIFFILNFKIHLLYVYTHVKAEERFVYEFN